MAGRLAARPADSSLGLPVGLDKGHFLGGAGECSQHASICSSRGLPATTAAGAREAAPAGWGPGTRAPALAPSRGAPGQGAAGPSLPEPRPALRPAPRAPPRSTPRGASPRAPVRARRQGCGPLSGGPPPSRRGTRGSALRRERPFLRRGGSFGWVRCGLTCVCNRFSFSFSLCLLNRWNPAGSGLKEFDCSPGMQVP